MTSKQYRNETCPFEQLREKAKALLADRPETDHRASMDVLELIDELSIHQAELEIQNEELRNAQSELSDLHREYVELFFESAPCGYVTIDPCGFVERVNLAASSLLQSDRADSEGRPFWTFVDAESQEEYHRTKRRLKETGKKQSVELKLVPNKEGRSFWVLADLVTDLDENGEIRRYRMTLSDITERKRNEEALERMRIIMSEGQRLAQFGSFEYVAATGETIWSDEEFRIYGLEPGPCSPSFVELRRNHFHPEDAARVEQKFSETLRKGSYYEIEHRIVRPDGDVRHLYNVAQPHIDAQGRLVKYIGATLDITDRRRAEEALLEANERFELVLAGAEAGIWDWDVPGRKVLFSPRWKTMRGFAEHDISDSEEEWSKRIHPEDVSRVLAAMREHFEGKTPVFAEEYRVQRKDGSWMWIADRGIARRDATGAVVRMAGSETDITERKRAEEALRESETRLRRLYESGMIGVFCYDLDGPVEDANDKFLEMAGYTREDLRAGRVRWDQMTPPEYRDRDEYGIAELKARGVDTPYEKEFIRKDGSRLPVIIGAAATDEDRHRGIAFVLDITERKRVEEELGESRARLSWTLERTGVGAWLNKLPFGELTWDGTTKKLFFVSPDAKPTIDSFWSRLHPDDREATEAAVEKAIREGTVYAIDHRAANPETGEIRWIRSIGQATYGDDGTPTRFDGVSLDITERKRSEEALRKSEEKYRALFGNMMEGFALCEIVTDDNGKPVDYRILEVNRAWEQVTGLSAEQVLGKPVKELIPNLERHWIDAYGRVALKGESLRLEQYNEFTGRWYEVGAHSPKPGLFVTLVTNVTERKLAEEELRRLNETLELKVAERTAVAETRALQLRRLALELSDAEDRERRRIADILHEDLQQYLAALRFQLQMYTMEKADDRRAGNLIEWVDESIRKCRSLSHELSPPVLHQSGLLAALNWLASDMRERHGMKVRFIGRPEAEPNSPALASMLFRSVRELLFNAVKHSGADSATVEARCLEDRILIRVEDYGKGFDPAALEAKEGNPKGFGLFAIRERIEFAGGRFGIDGAPGKGCRIMLEVPKEVSRKSEPPEATEAEAVPKEAEAGAPDGRMNIKVLVADDHAVLRQGLSRLLATEPDIEVVGQAADGLEAVRLASELAPDVVLMDVTMPVMDGIEATMRIAKAHPNIRIIGLSMHDDPGTREKMAGAGAAAYLYKASPVEMLLEAIRGSLL